MRVAWRAGLVLAVTIAGCLAPASVAVRASSNRAPAPSRALDRADPLAAHLEEPDTAGLEPLSLWATHYSIPRVRTVREGGIPLLDLEGRELGPSLAPRDFCRAAMAGTVEITMGTKKKKRKRLFRFEGLAAEKVVDCTQWYPRHSALGRSRFSMMRANAPRLARGEWLVPYRSLAVDPSVIPLGTVVYIPAARGTVIHHDGRTRIHDGYFYAVDRGGAIDGGHVDAFLGFAARNPFPFVKSDSDATYEAYLITDGEITGAFAELHGARGAPQG